MKSKTDLFHLIKAMSKSEKRYFTLDAQKSGRKESRYLELFQVINDLEEYDEAVLKTQFGKSLPTDKSYLYDAILRSMRDYRSANSYAAKIKEMIMDARYLYEHGLYELSESQLQKAKKLSLELGDQLSAIELNKEHRRLLKYTRQKGYEQKLEELILEKTTLIEQLDQELFFLDTHDKLLIELRKSSQNPTVEQQQEIEIRFNHLYKSIESTPTTPQGKLRFYQSLALLNQLLGKSDKVHQYYLQIIECWDSKPKYKEEEFYLYIVDISNLIQLALGDPAQSVLIPKLLAKLEKEQPNNLHDQKVLFQRITSFQLINAINTGDFSDVKGIIKRIEKGLKQYDIARGSEIVIIFNVAFLLFLAEEFKLCQNWTEKIMKRGEITFIRQDIQTASRIISLIASFEVEEFERIETLIRSTTRYLRKLEKKEDDFILAIFNFLKKMHINTDHLKVMKQIRKYVTAAINAKVKVALGLDELVLYWIEGKISNRSIATIIKTKLF